MKLHFLLLWLPMLLFGPDKGKRCVVRSDSAPSPIGPYSQAVDTDGALYISGQIALTVDGQMDTATFEAECKRVLMNISAILEAAGRSRQDVCKSTVYLTDLKNYQRFNNIYAEHFSKEPPAREVVEVRALPRHAHVEISVIAR